MSFKSKGTASSNQDAHTFPLFLCGAGGLVTFTKKSLGTVYLLGKPCITWNRETTFEKKS